MNRLLVFLFALSGCTSAHDGGQSTGQKPGVVYLDERLEDIIDPASKIEIIGEGYTWSEGPVWLAEHNMLLFSDVPENRIYKWNENEGVTLFLQPSGYTGSSKREGENGSNGLGLDMDGTLLLCQHGDRRIARYNGSLENPEPEFQTVVDNYQGKRLNSPNDLALDSQGNIYFTDPPYGLPTNSDSDEIKELDYQGVFRLNSDGTLDLLEKNITRPNGIALSPDERTLYVANSDPHQPVIFSFDIAESGALLNKSVLFDASDLEGPGLPDGLKVNSAGILFATGPGGVLVIDPAGEHLGSIQTGQATANVGWGPKEKQLFITADMYLMKIDLK